MGLKSKITNYFPAFTHRNFKLFWFGQIISLIARVVVEKVEGRNHLLNAIAL